MIASASGRSCSDTSREMSTSEVVTRMTWMPASASRVKTLAATPGVLTMLASYRATLQLPGRISGFTSGFSPRILPNTARALLRALSDREKLRRMVPPWGAVWEIISTLTSAFDMAVSTLAMALLSQGRAERVTRVMSWA